MGGSSGLPNVGAMAPVTVPAGRFADCFVIGEIARAGSGVDHWLCPGTGFARHESAACGPGAFFGRFTMYELMDVQIPPLVPVP